MLLSSGSTIFSSRTGWKLKRRDTLCGYLHDIYQESVYLRKRIAVTGKKFRRMKGIIDELF